MRENDIGSHFEKAAVYLDVEKTEATGHLSREGRRRKLRGF